MARQAARDRGHDVTITSLGDGRFLVTDSGRQRIAYAIESGTTRWIFLDGRTYVLEPEPEAEPEPATGTGSGVRTRNPERGTRNDDSALAAPMPATVSSIKVKVGDQVASGDVLIMLEAMKMELPIKAPRDGRVTAVGCREGELVKPGIPLVELE